MSNANLAFCIEALFCETVAFSFCTVNKQTTHHYPEIPMGYKCKAPIQELISEITWNIVHQFVVHEGYGVK